MDPCKIFLHRLLSGVAASALTLAMVTDSHAETAMPAVAAPNGKIDFSAGSMGQNPTAAVGGSYSLPVGHSYGIQLDGGFSKGSEDQSGGLAGHFFYRDPADYLAGVSSMWIRVNGRDVWRNGVEAEFYRGDMTFSASGGAQNGYGISTGFAAVEAGYYFSDYILVGIGASGFSSYRAIAASAEIQPMEDSPVSVFASGGAGNSGGGFAMVGLRYSFGADNISLKRQHREFDPPNILTQFSVGGSGTGVAQQIEDARPVAKAAVVIVCFVAGTLVRMADGSAKNIEDIGVDDVVHGMDGTANRVVKLRPSLLGERKLYAINGGTAFVTDSHPLMTRQGWKAIDPTESAQVHPDLDIGRLELGDVLVGLEGDIVVQTIESKNAHPGTKVFNISVTNNHTYYVAKADEPDTFILAHNK